MPEKRYVATTSQLFKCDQCAGLHLMCEGDDTQGEKCQMMAVFPPEQWAEMFMLSAEFRAIVSKMVAN